MGIRRITVNVTGGAGWTVANIGEVYGKIKVSINSTVGDDVVDVSFDGSTVHDTLGEFGIRPMEREYGAQHSYKIYFRCDTDAVIHVLVER